MIRSTCAVLCAVLLACGLRATAQPPQWSGPVLGQAASATSPGSDGSVLIARRSGLDPVRSVDGGQTWGPFTVAGIRPDRFLAAPADAQVVYALSGGILSGMHVEAAPSALYRSADAGATWQLVSSALQAGAGVSLGNVVAGADPDLVYATRMEPSSCFTGLCSFEGVEAFASRDGGGTWTSIDGGLQGTGRWLFPSASDGRIVYCATTAGLFRSADQGGSWRLVRASIDIDHGVYQRQVVVDRNDPSTVYIRFGNGTALWVTEDGGASWRTSDPINVPGSAKRLFADPAQAGRLFFMGSEGELFESRDRARSWARVAPSSGLAVAVNERNDFGDVHPVLFAQDRPRVFLAPASDGALHWIAIDDDAMALGSDLWWNPSKAGMGWTLTEHGSGQMYVAWYRYDEQGNATWQVVPGGTWLDARTFSGTLYEPRGPAYFQGAFDPSRVTITAAGTVSIRFDDDSNATFAYRFADGVQGEERITRQLFGPPVDWVLDNYADLWWNSAEPGWGLAVSHQYGKIFATWFVYDADGRAQWVVMPDANYSYTLVGQYIVAQYSGMLYATQGPPFGAFFDPASVNANAVGNATLVFTGRGEAQLRYQAFGAADTRLLTRQPF